MRHLLGGLLSGCAAFGAPDLDPTAQSSDAIAARIPKQETGSEKDHLTGEWHGLRPKLVDRGIHIYAGYTGEILANISGGLRRGAIYEGLLEMSVDFDTRKLGLWEDGLLHVSSIYPHGSGLSENYVGDLMTLSNIDAYDSIRLYELWFQQNFADQKFSIRFGQLLADEEFTFLSSDENFIHSSFGWPAFISGNAVNTGPAFYVGAVGMRARFQPNENWYFQTGVFDGDTFDSPTGNPKVNATGTHVHLSGDQGFFWITEAAYNWDPNGSLPGVYKAGFWLHSGDFVSNFHDRNGDPFIVTGLEPVHHSRNFGGYLAAEQTVARKDEHQALSLFARVGASPPDRSLFELVVDGGLTLSAPLPGRFDDEFGVGVAYARLSRDIAKTERLDTAINGSQYNGFSEHETALEIFYNAQVTKWWTIQPDFQWIFNPGGNTGASDAIVVGVRSSIVF
jgi:porin